MATTDLLLGVPVIKAKGAGSIMKQAPPQDRAFTRLELVVVIAVLGLLGAFLLTAQSESQAQTAEMRCRENLKNMGIAFRVFATDNGNKFPMQLSRRLGGTLEFSAGGNAFRHFQALSNELWTPLLLVCPADSRVSAGREIDSFQQLTNTNLSYFVGLNALLTQPAMLLSGDRHLTNGVAPLRGVLDLTARRPAGWTAELHTNRGNVVFADGSVQSLTSQALNQWLNKSPGPTQRLAMPY